MLLHGSLGKRKYHFSTEKIPFDMPDRPKLALYGFVDKSSSLFLSYIQGALRLVLKIQIAQAIVEALITSELAIRNLSMASNEIGDVGAAAVARLLDDVPHGYLCVLSSLNLRGNNIGPRGCQVCRCVFLYRAKAHQSVLVPSNDLHTFTMPFEWGYSTFVGALSDILPQSGFGKRGGGRLLKRINNFLLRPKL